MGEQDHLGGSEYYRRTDLEVEEEEGSGGQRREDVKRQVSGLYAVFASICLVIWVPKAAYLLWKEGGAHGVGFSHFSGSWK